MSPSKAILGAFLCVLEASCVSFKETDAAPVGAVAATHEYKSLGGDAAVEFSNGSRLTHTHTKSLQHVVQGVVALGASVAGAIAQKSSDALSATKDTNAAGVTKNAADNLTKQKSDALNAASTDLKTSTHGANAVELSKTLGKGPPKG